MKRRLNTLKLLRLILCLPLLPFIIVLGILWLICITIGNIMDSEDWRQFALGMRIDNPFNNVEWNFFKIIEEVE